MSKIKLTRQEAIDFQDWLLSRFGPLGSHFGIDDQPPDLALIEPTEPVELPEEAGWTFLIPAWRLENGRMVADHKRTNKPS